MKLLLPILFFCAVAVGVFFLFYFKTQNLLAAPLAFEPEIVNAGFQINPPKKWAEDKLLSSKNPRYLAGFSSGTKTAKTGKEAYTYSATIDVVVMEPTKETDLAVVVSKNKSLIQKASADTTFIKDESIVINKANAHVLEFISNYSQKNLENAAKELGKVNEDIKWHESQSSHSIYVFFIHKGHLYFVSGTAFENHWSEFKDEITASIKSFRFLN